VVNTATNLKSWAQKVLEELLKVAAKALLARNANPTEDDVRWALSGNLCRCTGYQNIVKAVLWAAEKMRAQNPQEA
jgi:carbon-monoxide dehydrogenase small subunit